MVVYQKWFEDEIARWKVRRPRYVLSKQLKKIHMQQRWKMGSGARMEEAIPEGRRDVTRRAPAAGIYPYCGSEQVAKALPCWSLVRERRVPQIGRCCLNAVEQRNDAHPPFPPADGMRPDH